MKKLSISIIIRLVLLSIIISLFFACSNSDPNKVAGQPTSLEKFKQTKNSKTTEISHAYWSIPKQYQNITIEQIKSQTKITEYKTIKGAATTAGTERMTREGYTSLVKGGGKVQNESQKNINDRKDLASYTNKLVTLEGIINTIGTQKTSPLDITEREPGKYEMWFCDKTRKPCRYRALLLYIGPEGKGNTLFKLDDKIRFWGVILDEEIYDLGTNYKRYPRIRVFDLEIIS